MKKILFSIVAFSSAIISCVNGGTNKNNFVQNDNAKESLILRQDTTGLVRVKSSGGYDTLVQKEDVEKVQHEHYRRYSGRGSFHSTSFVNGKSTHYACTHSSHTSHYSSYNPNRN